MAHDPVTGRHTGPIDSHMEGWNAAIEDALSNTGWDPDTYDNVKVEFFAKIRVVNPGSIVEYSVTLIPGS